MAKNLEVTLSVTIIKEGDSFVAYSPALDISTVGNTFEEAQKRFEEAVAIFFEEIHEAGTAQEALLELGWKKEDKTMSPPVVVSTQSQNFSVGNFMYA